MIRNNLIAGNVVRAGGSYSWAGGGGIQIGSSNAALYGNKIRGNRAIGQDSPGGGIGFWHSSSACQYNEITGNTSDCCGGGILAEQADPTIDNNLIAENSENAGGYEYGGGGIFLVDSTARVSRNLIRSNHATGPGSAIKIDTLNFDTYPLILDNVLFRNSGAPEGVIGFARAGDWFLCADVIGNIFAGHQETCIEEVPALCSCDDVSVPCPGPEGPWVIGNRFYRNGPLYQDVESGGLVYHVRELNALPEAEQNLGTD